MAKEFVYNKVTEIVELGDASVEIGHYTVDGKQMADKVYLVARYKKKDGTEKSRINAICTVDEAKELGKILQSV